MYINTFKYSPQDVSCQLCTEYVKKVGCTALRCPWLAERIEAGVVGYARTCGYLQGGCRCHRQNAQRAGTGRLHHTPKTSRQGWADLRHGTYHL